MSEFAREALPIVVMYGFVLLLGPFIGYAMYLAFDGDRLREPELEVEATAPRAVAVDAPAATAPAAGVRTATSAA